MDNKRKKLRLGDVLVQNGVITEEDLQRGLERQKGSGRKLGETLVDEGIATEENIARALSNQFHYDMVDLSNVEIPQEILDLVPANVLKKHRAIPFEYSPDNMNVLRVAMSDPMDIGAMDDINIITNLQVEPVVATMGSVMLAIDRYYGQAEVNSALEEYTREKESQMIEQEDMYSEDVNNSPIVQLVKGMIDQAVRQRASDIHIEPMEKQVRIRYRIDGALYEKSVYSIRLLPAIVARIKIIGGMDISEKRKPQDGRITQIVDRKEFDIRVSILPTVYGEKIVMRLTSKNALTKEKSQLGLKPDELKKFDHILKHPHGILLVTGPTGSGKSTTLYTALSELNKEDVNIITVEAPVEAGQVMGTMTLFYEDEVYGTLDLVAVTSVERSDLLYKKEQFFAFWQSSGVKLVLAVTFMLAGIVILRLLVFRKKRRPRAGAARSRGNYRGTRMR